MRRTIFLLAAAIAATSFPVRAEIQPSLMISSAPTHNVSCSGGVCQSTSKRGVLNVDDLTTMLATSDISVETTTHSKDIIVAAPIAWASTHRLTLAVNRSLIVKKPIAVNGTGALTINANPSLGANYEFVGQGKVTFLDTNSDLMINGADYALAGDVAGLAAAVTANQTGHFALAHDYDAGPDGIYAQSPVSILGGTFEGLGNTMKNLRITDPDRGVHVGLFYQVNIVSHFHLTNSRVVATGTNATVGLLAGECDLVSDVSVSGTVSGLPGSLVGGMCGLGENMSYVHSSGQVTGKGNTSSAANAVGGLVGMLMGGTIANAYSTVHVTGAKGWVAGGLVGATQSSNYRVTTSYATGVVTVGNDGIAGGLVGNNGGDHPIDNSYATGFVGGGVGSSVGGLIGMNSGPVGDCYSTGPVASGSGNAVGGLIGFDTGPSDLTDTYWDTTTSGQSHGVGNNTAYPGVTGLTTEELQAGLPTGFSDVIWAEDAQVNGGLPYLLALPPKN